MLKNRINHKLIRVIIIIIGAILVVGFLIIRLMSDKPVHYHAGFKVYVDGFQVDFSEDKYMNFTVCSLRGKSNDNQLEKAHLHDNVPDVVHVHRSGATWGDLFKNIHYTFPAGKPIVGYKNGQKIADILSEPIRPYDSIIIIVGNGADVDLTSYVTQKHIREIEQKSESCGS